MGGKHWEYLHQQPESLGVMHPLRWPEATA